MQTRTVLISGASIAGPALALWLSRYGFRVTVIERAPSIRPGGYAVDFRGTALHALERMGVLDEIKRHEVRTGAITIVDKHNKKIVSMPDGFTSGELEIMRGDLALVLYNATRHDAEYIFDDTITGITQTPEGADVTFARSPARRFDLVIGADGLHSNVRALAFGEESRFVHNLGYYIAIFSIPNFMDLDRSGLYYGTLGKRVGIFAARNNTAATASFFLASPPLTYDRRNIAQQKQLLRDHFANDEWQVPRLLELMQAAPDFYFDSISQVRMDTWSNGRAALLGDAGYCASPVSGMGTSMAIVGAAILAGELHHAAGDHTIAFPRYESHMRGFVTQAQKLAEGADWFVPTTRFKLWFSQQMWKILPHTPWKNIMIEMPLKVANSVTLKDYELETAKL